MIDIDLAGMTDDSSISTLLGLGAGPHRLRSAAAAPRAAPIAVAGRRAAGIDGCAVTIRDTIAAALRGRLHGRHGPAHPARRRRSSSSTAPVVGPERTVATGSGPAGGPPRPALVARADVITGSSSGAAPTPAPTWIRHELLEPLRRHASPAPGYAATFDPAFVAWLDHHLPTDGTSPEAYSSIGR